MSIKRVCRKPVREEGTIRANKIFLGHISGLIREGMKIIGITTKYNDGQVESITYELIPNVDPRYGWTEA